MTLKLGERYGTQTPHMDKVVRPQPSEAAEQIRSAGKGGPKVFAPVVAVPNVVTGS